MAVSAHGKVVMPPSEIEVAQPGGRLRYVADHHGGDRLKIDMQIDHVKRTAAGVTITGVTDKGNHFLFHQNPNGTMDSIHISGPHVPH